MIISLNYDNITKIVRISLVYNNFIRNGNIDKKENDVFN